MAWKVEFDPAAVWDLEKLDRQVARRILTFLHERISSLDDPRSVGQALKGAKLKEFWKYRVGDYRIICTLEVEILTVRVIKIGNCREVYR